MFSIGTGTFTIVEFSPFDPNGQPYSYQWFIRLVSFLGEAFKTDETTKVSSAGRDIILMTDCIACAKTEQEAEQLSNEIAERLHLYY
jgi:hypothetical protein